MVDLDTDLVLAAAIYLTRDQATTIPHLAGERGAGALNVIEAESPANIKGGGRQGYHAAETLTVVNETLNIRTYI